MTRGKAGELVTVGLNKLEATQNCCQSNLTGCNSVTLLQNYFQYYTTQFATDYNEPTMCNSTNETK